jgi:flagellar basal body-associated protein FliL
MSDIFRDPLLFLPVIAILVIFSAFYITAMIWSYNRDAKKQGKKSGCLPMVILFILIVITGCHSGTTHTLHGSSDEVWQAVQEGRPWFKHHQDTFDNDTRTAVFETNEWGRTSRYRIRVFPSKPHQTHSHNVIVRYSEWTGLLNEWPSSKADCVAVEISTLDQIEERLKSIRNID